MPPNLALLSPFVNRSVYYRDMSGSGTQARPQGGRGARERIERAAAELFYRNGIHATGVELVAQHANVSKRTLYQHFSSKSDLVDNYLDVIDRQGGTAVEQRLGDTDLAPRERLLAIFEAPL